MASTVAGIELPAMLAALLAVSNLSARFVLASRGQTDSSIALMKLYVERARLEAWLGAFETDTESRISLKPKTQALVEQLVVRAKQELEEGLRLLDKRRFDQSTRGRPRRGWSLTTLTTENRLLGITENLKRLNDMLYELMEVHLISPPQTKSFDNRLLEDTFQIEDSPAGSDITNYSLSGESSSLRYSSIFSHRSPTNTSNTSYTSSRHSLREAETDGFIYDLWHATVDGFKEAGNSLIRSLKLRRTFVTAAERLNVWGSDFDFPLAQIDLILLDNPSLHEGVSMVLAAMTTMLWKLLSDIDPGHQAVSVRYHAHLGRCMKQINQAETRFGTSVDEYSRVPLTTNYKSLGSSTPNEGVRRLLRTSVNEQCTMLNKFISAINRAHRRFQWCCQEHKAGQEAEEKLNKELLPIPAKDLLKNTIEAAEHLNLHLSTTQGASAFSEAPQVAHDPPKAMPQLEQEVREQLSRLKSFMDDVGSELDGSLVERNPEAQQAVTFSLKHLHYILAEAITHLTGSGEGSTSTAAEPAATAEPSSSMPQPMHKSGSDPTIDALKKKMHDHWDSFPSGERREIEKAHAVKDLAGAVREFKEINDSLGVIKNTIRFTEQLPAYSSKPAVGEMVVAARA